MVVMMPWGLEERYEEDEMAEKTEIVVGNVPKSDPYRTPAETKIVKKICPDCELRRNSEDREKLKRRQEYMDVMGSTALVCAIATGLVALTCSVAAGMRGSDFRAWMVGCFDASVVAEVIAFFAVKVS